MKKLIAPPVLLALSMIAPSAFPLGLFLIQSTSVVQMDADSYRLRIDVVWSGETIQPPPGDTTYLGAGSPVFTTFGLSSSVTAYNLYSIQNGEEVYSQSGDPFWIAPLTGPHVPGTLGNTFGYDFDYSGSLANMPLTSTWQDWIGMPPG